MQREAKKNLKNGRGQIFRVFPAFAGAPASAKVEQDDGG